MRDPTHPYKSWCERLAEHLDSVANASLEERASRPFQQRLWDEDIIGATGQGNVNVGPALDDDSFRQWIAQRSVEPLPEDEGARTAALRDFYSQLKARIGTFRLQRTPYLKMFRVLASLYPRSFTTISDISKLRRLHDALFPGERRDEVERHQAVLRKLAEVLGQPRDPAEWVVRMTLPWRMYEILSAAAPQPDPQPAPQPGGTDAAAGSRRIALDPLPAVRRRRGLTAIKGSLDTAVRVLDFVGEGIAREDLLAFVKQDNPGLQAASINMVVNVLQSELGVLARQGDQLVPTDSGRRLLDSGDASVLAPWLLTRVLGVDHVLVQLRDHGPARSSQLVELLQAANPGWTSAYAPQATLAWLRSFGVIETNRGEVSLTARGREWAALVTWIPERLTRSADGPIVEEDDDEGVPEQIEVPPLRTILERLPKDRVFSLEQVATLHAALWAHPRRHFAILTGLSGSGKTSLAREYARALAAGDAAVPTAARLLTVPVSPGWTDPSALLGYVNPLRRDEYVATPFAHFLVSCATNPTQVHVAVLDEMNLSHPEQYLAPLLSAMETGDEPIVLHHEGAAIDGIPERLDRYPANLVLVGTVNMDETTHGLSDKVLDRAATIEFWTIDLDSYPGWGRRGIEEGAERRARDVLMALMTALAPVRLHFGWRVVDDVLDFLKQAASDGVLEPTAALDWIVHSKVVPKLRGHDAPQFQEAFAACEAALREHGLSRSRDKVHELLRDLKETGSARFWR